MKKGLILCMVVIYFVLQSAAAIAGTFTVSIAPDPDCSNNTCDFQSALTTAATNGEDDILELVEEGNYIPTFTFTYDSSESNSLTIIGAGKSATYLKGDGTNQVLWISTSATSNAHITISDLTIA